MASQDRRDFLKKTSLFGLATLLPGGSLLANTEDGQRPTTCTLVPTETAGPFPLDLTANNAFFRQDVRENKTGVQLNLKLRILGAGNCLPMPNLRVNIWHCDRTGLYSGYSQTNNPGQAGLTYLRGYQFTDSNGEVEFITVFPGWYSGRICHIHFQVFVSSAYAAISQLTFPITEKQALYAANSNFYTNGADPMTLASDNIFSDGYAYQMATLTPNAATGGYNSYLEVTIQGNGVATSVGNLEKENTKHFSMGQNFPNPYEGVTRIPVHLTRQAVLSLELYDLQGKKVASKQYLERAEGDHLLEVNLNEMGLPNQHYVYQLRVKNALGEFVDAKLMSGMR